MSWKVQDIFRKAGQVAKEGLIAILRGKLLLRLNVGRYLLHIIWLFILVTALIWFNLKVESTLAKVEKNKSLIENAEALHSQKEFEIRQLTRRKLLDDKLRESGSKVREPAQSATVLE